MTRRHDRTGSGRANHRCWQNGVPPRPARVLAGAAHESQHHPLPAASGDLPDCGVGAVRSRLHTSASCVSLIAGYAVGRGGASIALHERERSCRCCEGSRPLYCSFRVPHAWVLLDKPCHPAIPSSYESQPSVLVLLLTARTSSLKNLYSIRAVLLSHISSSTTTNSS
jgi:hypothetical protein